MSTTPNEVNEKRNTSAAAAARAGRRSGSVTVRSRSTGPAPSVAAASQTRGSSLPHQAPTTLTTTATLKKTCAARIAAIPRSWPAGRISRNAVATTTVGSTNGTSTNARISTRPRKSKRARTHASGRPRSSVSAVDAAACQMVNQSTRSVVSEPSTSVGRPPSLRPRARIVASGYTKNSARKAAGTSTAVARSTVSEARSRSTL